MNLAADLREAQAAGRKASRPQARAAPIHGALNTPACDHHGNIRPVGLREKLGHGTLRTTVDPLSTCMYVYPSTSGTSQTPNGHDFSTLAVNLYNH